VTTPAFLFQHRTSIDFEAGSLARLGEHLAGLSARRALLVSDAGLEQAGLVDRAAALMDDAGLAVGRYLEVSPNPRDGECRAAADVALDTGADAIVGVGGGSVMDTTKAAAALVTNGGSVKDWEDPRRLEAAPLPTICVPTTAGTGSEVTFVAVITDEREHYKMTLLDPRLAPDIALLDPELTLTLPPQTTASTGMDALIQAIEAYTGRASSPITDALALHAAGLIAAHLERAVAEGGDLEARSAMLLGSLMAGMAFGNSDVGSVHSMGETIGGLYDTPHGVACAVFLPYVFEYNVAADPARHATIARVLGVPDDGRSDEEVAADGVAAIRRLMAAVAIPPLRELEGVSPADFEKLAHLSAEHVCTPDNAREIGYEEYLALFKRAYEQT
jgi:alcohol dehydrogenase